MHEGKTTIITTPEAGVRALKEWGLPPPQLPAEATDRNKLRSSQNLKTEYPKAARSGKYTKE
ncbi:Hypothetical predicted protein [Pelobates cultripes]|uniref:Uncharacterized protein n=1 Tax=Pelobates cultripes TaxID=61616 RepID=A0AAD1TE36_PELCU|nr:Hypothetical predicted protein [Pelobates cultripes]